MNKKQLLLTAGRIVCALYSLTVMTASCFRHSRYADGETIFVAEDCPMLCVQSAAAPPDSDDAQYVFTPEQPEHAENGESAAACDALEDNPALVAIDLHNSDAWALSNETAYQPALQTLFQSPLPQTGYVRTAASADSAESAPLVLILHTHGTECYADDMDDPTSYSFRTDDTARNVVAVGEVYAQTLLDRGISALHCTVMHDRESYITAYSRAAETIRAYLKEYPSIRYVLDIHRDALERSDGSILRPVVAGEAGNAAQVMLVVGTDELGGNHPLWQQNLALALRLQGRLEESCPGITRAVNLRSATFNQQYTSGSLLIETGSTGNTLAEAKKSAEIVANALADLITGAS